MKSYSFLLLLVLAALAPGCFSITRTETDLYTITRRDTTIREDVHNAPGQRDSGTIYPSPRTVEIIRRYVQQDSIVNRYYPAFLRLGGIEAAGFVAPGGSTQGSGHGLFGLYNLLRAKRTDETKTLTADMYRLMPYEVRLRWFDDAPDWTIGTAAFEMFVRQKDSSAELAPGEALIGVAPLYIRKRFFFRKEPPYVMLVPFFGFSYFPSQYVNLGATFDVGSYGGFNLRAYAGVVAGGWTLFSGTREGFFDVESRRFGPNPNPIPAGDFDLTFPYFGIGVSALDFVNTTEELFVEWKNHRHSAIEVSGLNVDLVHSFSATRPFLASPSDSTKKPGAITGTILKVATATYPLPIADGRFFVGTSLFNLIALSSSEIAFGFLPLRAGYRFNVLSNQLNFEPFAELTYYPSTAFHVGGRLALGLTDWSQLNVVLGWVHGSTNIGVLAGLEDLQIDDSFDGVYLGVGVGIGDVFHTPEEVLRR